MSIDNEARIINKLDGMTEQLAGHLAFCKEHCKKVDDIARALWGNGHKGIRRDLDDVTASVLPLKRLAWLIAAALVGDIAVRILTP